MIKGMSGSDNPAEFHFIKVISVLINLKEYNPRVPGL